MISRVRSNLKRQLMFRDRYCLQCGVPLIEDVNIDMHEGIISRAEMMGLPDEKKEKLFNQYNCVLICHNCNVNFPPKRKEVWDYLVSVYGKEKVEEEYQKMISLFKSRRPLKV